MTALKRTTFLLILLAVLSPITNFQPLSSAADAIASDAPDHVVKVLYFHRRFRCPSCLVIENAINQSLNTNFAEYLKSGHIDWRVINLDEKGNAHYSDDYDFFYNTLIVADSRGGKDVNFKNLEQVFQLGEDPEAIKELVRKEVGEYLDKK